MGSLKKSRFYARRSSGYKWWIMLLGVFLFISSLMILLVSIHGLPKTTYREDDSTSFRRSTLAQGSENGVSLGFFGEKMVGMLGTDLPFTIFVPSDQVFEEVLKIRVNNSGDATEREILLSRIVGFSAVPQHLLSSEVLFSKEVSLYSISGFRLDVTKDDRGVLVVNNVHSKLVDLRRKEVIVHIMSGVIMDSEFEQLIRPDDEG